MFWTSHKAAFSFLLCQTSLFLSFFFFYLSVVTGFSIMYPAYIMRFYLSHAYTHLQYKPHTHLLHLCVHAKYWVWSCMLNVACVIEIKLIKNVQHSQKDSFVKNYFLSIFFFGCDSLSVLICSDFFFVRGILWKYYFDQICEIYFQRTFACGNGSTKKREREKSRNRKGDFWAA